MDMAKIVWKASREQFKYALAMNDIVYKADMQMKNSELPADTAAWAALSANRPVINFLSAPSVDFKLSPDEFWRMFTAPSLKAMLHYSVNSYNNNAVIIANPVADAFHDEKRAEEDQPIVGDDITSPVDETLPADETPVDTTPVDETPAEETPAEETPVDETPVDSTPVAADETSETPAEATEGAEETS
jgi:hypothetical protein